MSFDPYSLCPCGSGKKLKFCCPDIAGEMFKAVQLHENGQSRAALKILSKLHEKEPGRPWVATTLAGIHLYLEEPEKTREALQQLLKEHPDDPLARVLDASAALELEDYADARKTIHLAFTKSVKKLPEMVGSLASGLSMLLLLENKYMASRQHLAFALRFANDQEREDLFVRLLHMDSDDQVAYPLRGGYNPRKLVLDEAGEAINKKANGLAFLGCWHEAAALLSPLAESRPEDADLWYNLGLYHAWDGAHPEAIRCLRQAAEHSSDRDFAVTAETLAQTLEQEESVYTCPSYSFVCQSSGKVLSILDDIPWLERMFNVEGETNHGNIITTYSILDRPACSPPDSYESIAEFLELPRNCGFINLSDFGEQEDTRVIAEVALGLGAQPELIDRLRDAVGTAWAEIPYELEPYAINWSDYQPYNPGAFYYPSGLPGNIQYKLQQLRRERSIDQQWMNDPKHCLDDKTPREAAEIPELSIRLEAALNCLEAFYWKSQKQRLDYVHIHERLGLPPAKPYDITDNNQLNSCNQFELLRVPLDSLDENQLRIVVDRTLVLSHPRLQERVFAQVFKYPRLYDIPRMRSMFLNYLDIVNKYLDTNSFRERVRAVRDWQREVGDDSYEERLGLDMRELISLLRHNLRDEAEKFVQQIHDEYLRKLPEFEEPIVALLQSVGMTPPWMSKSPAAGELWSPEAPASTSAGGKLWLPGQE